MTKKLSLLEKAKEVKVNRNTRNGKAVTREELELVMVHIAGEISLKQLGAVIDSKTQPHNFVTQCLISATKQGFLIVK